MAEKRAVSSLKPHPLNEQIYAPAGGPEFEDLKRSMSDSAIGLLEPLVTLPDGTIISGHRRWQAAQSLGWETIDCEVKHIDDPAAVEEQLIEYNRYRRKTFSEIMRETRHLEALYSARSALRQGQRTDLPDRQIPEEERGDTRAMLAQWAGVGERTFDKMKRIHEASANSPMIAEKVKALDEGRTSIESVFKLAVALEKPSDEFQPKVYDIWYFGGLNPKYGKPHPGSLPGDYVANVVHYWSEEGDFVVDPFAGGGITIDVCKDMKRVCFASDIDPRREDIFKWNMQQGYPPYPQPPQLVFLDPPYWNMVAEDYSEDGVASMDFIGFLQFLKKLAHDTAAVLEPGGVVAAVIMKQKFRLPEGLPFMDWPFTWYTFFRETGLAPVDRIMLPWPTNIWQAFHVERAKENRQILPLAGDMLVFTKPLGWEAPSCQ